MQIDVTYFGPRKSNTLEGFITVRFSDLTTGLEIELPGFMLHQKDKRSWIEFPGRQDKNGKWSKTITVYNKEMERLFKAKIMKELKKYLENIGDEDYELY